MCEGGGDTDASADPLAVVVEKPRSEVAIDSLREEGVYDDDRRVREFDAERVALPVTDPPESTGSSRSSARSTPTIAPGTSRTSSPSGAGASATSRRFRGRGP